MNIFDVNVMDEEDETDVLRHSKDHVSVMLAAFQSQALRHILDGDETTAANVMAHLLIELDVATTMCVDLLTEWGISDDILVQLRERADEVYEQRFGKPA